MWTKFRTGELKEGRFEYPNIDGRIILKYQNICERNMLAKC